MSRTSNPRWQRMQGQRPDDTGNLPQHRKGKEGERRTAMRINPLTGVNQLNLYVYHGGQWHWVSLVGDSEV